MGTPFGHMEFLVATTTACNIRMFGQSAFGVVPIFDSGPIPSGLYPARVGGVSRGAWQEFVIASFDCFGNLLARDRISFFTPPPQVVTVEQWEQVTVSRRTVMHRSRPWKKRGGTRSARCADVLATTDTTAISSSPGARENLVHWPARQPPNRCETALKRDGLFHRLLATSAAARRVGAGERLRRRAVIRRAGGLEGISAYREGVEVSPCGRHRKVCAQDYGKACFPAGRCERVLPQHIVSVSKNRTQTRMAAP